MAVHDPGVGVAADPVRNELAVPHFVNVEERGED
jgi:hypothetical protein